MTTYIILAQSEVTTAVLAGYCALTTIPYQSSRTGSACEPQRIIWTAPVAGVEAYRAIADELEILASDSDGIITSGQVVVLVDHVNLDRLDPLSNDGWESIIALLILTFPEIRWVFANCTGGFQQPHSIPRQHSWLSLRGPHLDPLFDATGLRDWVRSQAGVANTDLEPTYLPRRGEVAVAIDDERSYAYLNAYSAYRFGFRAYAITDETALEYVLGPNGVLRTYDGFRLAIEDLALNFPDRSSKHRDTRWSDLYDRSLKLPALDKPGVLRTFVTSGLNSPSINIAQQQNREFRRELQHSGRLGTIVHKPVAGIFDVWNGTGLIKKLHGGRSKGQAQGFMWPPRGTESADSPSAHDHSSPGRLLEVSTRLERRAEELLQSTHSVARAVQGAVLATDAMEMLGGRTPTTSLEALALKHTFEAISECQFYGVQSHFDVRSRINEIRLEVQELARSINYSRRKETEWNAEAAVLDDLIRVYRQYNQFDEEVAVHVRSRTIHRRLWFKKHLTLFGDQLRWLNPVYWAACYVEVLLRSLPAFLLAIGLWVTGLTILYTAARLPTGDATLHRGAEDAITSFFSMGGPIHHDANAATPARTASDEPADEASRRLRLLEADMAALRDELTPKGSTASYTGVVCLAIIAGFLHGGIFISHLYALMMRR